MEKPSPRTLRIATLNDLFRASLTSPYTNLSTKNKLFITAGVSELPFDKQFNILVKVRDFNSFTEGNDPYGEHDFGSFEHHGENIFWKIDYYDPDMESGSEEPDDPNKTVRVLTVMFAHEY